MNRAIKDISQLPGISHSHRSQNISLVESNLTQDDKRENNQNSYYNFLLPSLIQFAVSGLVAGFSLFLGNIFLDRHRKPKISFDKKPVLRNQESFELFKGGNEPFRLDVKYEIQRIKVTNYGRNAAEGCKGVLTINEVEEKLCWHVAKERYTMTINSNSFEYLEVCAILVEDPDEVIKRLREQMKKFGNEVRAIEMKKYIDKYYNCSEDIPRIITPTEDGWLSVEMNRKINSGSASIIVSSKNASPCKGDVIITEDNQLQWKSE